jgi:hypothetical protein
MRISLSISFPAEQTFADSPDFREPSDLAIEEAEQAIAASMSTNDKAAAQAIASALSGTTHCDSRMDSSLIEQTSLASSPDFLNSSDFLAPPVSPWDDLLTTPALDADVSATPDIYTSPALMGFGDDFDNPPSLFGGNAYDGYDAKASMSSSLSPSDLPLPDMDDMYTISPGTPAIDAVSLDASPFHVDDSSYLPTRRKNAPTGTRKNTTPESLVPYDAPIQTRKYCLPSTTSRKELPATFARKRARTQDLGEDDGRPGATLSEEDVIKAKRLQNTLAARRSRKRKLEYQHELEDAIENERKEKETWRARTLILETLLRDKGYESPKYLE